MMTSVRQINKKLVKHGNAYIIFNNIIHLKKHRKYRRKHDVSQSIDQISLWQYHLGTENNNKQIDLQWKRREGNALKCIALNEEGLHKKDLQWKRGLAPI